MMKLALSVRCPSRTLVARSSSRRMMITAAQKRALEQQQLAGSSESKAPPTPTPTPPKSGGGGGGLGALPLVVVGIVGGAYAADQFDMLNGVRDAMGLSKPPKQEEAPKEAPKEEIVIVEVTPWTDGVSVESMHQVGYAKSITDPETRPDICIRGPSHPEDGNQVQFIETKYVAKEEVSESGAPQVEAVVMTTQETVAEPPKETPKPLDAKPPPSLAKALKELSSKLTGVATTTTPKSVPVDLPQPDPLTFKYLAHLEKLSVEELRERLVQLTSEINRLLQYEAIRLQHVQEELQRQLSRDHMDAMHQQKLVLEQVLAEKIQETRDAMHQEMKRALEDKESQMQTLLNQARESLEQEHAAELETELEAQNMEFQAKFEQALRAKVAELQGKYAQTYEGHVQTLQALQSRLQELETVHSASKSYESTSRLAHQISAAALQLIAQLEAGNVEDAQLQSLLALLEGTQSEPVLKSALEHLPPHMTPNLPTVFELQTTFDSQIYPTARIAAQVPAGKTSLGAQLLGRVFAAITFPPAPLATNDVEAGTILATTSNPVTDWVAQSHQWDSTLSTVKHLVMLGDLSKAVSMLETNIPPDSQLAFTLQDWISLVKQRVAVDQVVRVLKLECAVLNERMKNA